ncbi:hypothetical protein [Enterocloster lavalensis]|uniref:hypothetical protein n=1 Tax=Enterocloster lavalensis TaxID=460384 RepID=UPI00140CFE9D|nr:hypothetical protein [Enterocloster lavalensis]
MKKEFIMRFAINNTELQEVFEELHNAQQTIYECYRKLEDMGVVVMEGDSGHSEE